MHASRVLIDNIVHVGGWQRSEGVCHTRHRPTWHDSRTDRRHSRQPPWDCVCSHVSAAEAHHSRRLSETGCNSCRHWRWGQWLAGTKESRHWFVDCYYHVVVVIDDINLIIVTLLIAVIMTAHLSVCVCVLIKALKQLRLRLHHVYQKLPPHVYSSISCLVVWLGNVWLRRKIQKLHNCPSGNSGGSILEQPLLGSSTVFQVWVVLSWQCHFAICVWSIKTCCL